VEERHLAGVTTPMTGVWPTAAAGAAPGAAAGAAPATAPGAVPTMAGGGFHSAVPTMSHEFHPIGRDLAAYRSAPILFATRPPPIARRD
jgi:hypothetical protein